jgi:hypothetical protein
LRNAQSAVPDKVRVASIGICSKLRHGLHRLSSAADTVHGITSCELTAVLGIVTGDSVIFPTLDAGLGAQQCQVPVRLKAVIRRRIGDSAYFVVSTSPFSGRERNCEASVPLHTCRAARRCQDPGIAEGFRF